MLRLFANAMTTDDMYSWPNMQNFLQELKRYYLKNGRLFLDFLLHFSNVHEIQNMLIKKDECPSLIISEIIVSERDCYWNV